MTRRGRLIFVLAAIVILVVGGVFAALQVLGSRVAMNDVTVVGNTAGNVNNGGYFCERDGVVYFANPADEFSLYSMNSNETGYKKLSKMSVSNILCGGKFLYFFLDSHTQSVSQGLGSVVTEYGIYRMRNDGKYTVCLLREIAEKMQLGGSYLYYEQGDDVDGELNRIRIDKKNRTGYGKTPPLYDEHINPAAYENGRIYYNSVALGHNLYQLNVESDAPYAQLVFMNNVYEPIVQGSYVYFLNAQDSYRVYRYYVPTGALEALSPYGADAYNLNDFYVYYNSPYADTPGLYRMSLNGGTNELLVSGAYNSLHLTSNYLYYKMYGVDDIFYHIPLNGAAVPSMFNPETDN